jgi:hypothetical protein
MKRRVRLRIALIAAVGMSSAAMAKKAPPPPAAPATPPEAPPSDALEAEVQRVATASSPGAKRVGGFYRGAGDKSSHTDWFVPLEAGTCYFFVGVGGAGIEFLSL